VSSPDDPAGRPGRPGRLGGLGRAGGSRSPLSLAIAGTVAVLFFVLFVALGTWQVKRRVWKLDLIVRVEQRVHAPAVAAPGPAQWPNISAAAYEYRHVTAAGTFLDGSQTLVQAVTDLGAGYWTMTPLRLTDGSIVLVNRGFVAADDRDRIQPATPAHPGAVSVKSTTRPDLMPAGPTPAPVAPTPVTAALPPVPASQPSSTATITGLLRITEPHGGFLRHNDPTANKWYSRDVQAIAAARGLTRVAPYFIDAEAGTGDAKAGRAAPTRQRESGGLPGGLVAPTPGLTVVTFHNSHLVYAITWYTLALMAAIAIPVGLRRQ
jgi:surfeit locus 1 family protein